MTTSSPLSAAVGRPWAATKDTVVGEMELDPKVGLRRSEAASRLRRHGANVLDQLPPATLWQRLTAQLGDPLTILLLVATAISVAAWVVEGAEGAPVDAIVIVVIVIANAVLGLWQEAKAEDAVAALQIMTAPAAVVRRSGLTIEIPADDVVPGDVLVLAEGDAVPADGRLIESVALNVAEAALTGESEPVLKGTATVAPDAVIGERTNMAYRGTSVVSGYGTAVVTATGMATEMGRIAELLNQTEAEPTPLAREVSRISRVLGLGVVAVAFIVVVTIFLTSEISTATDVVDVLLIGVSLAVAAVPEGLAAILSVVLALGVRRMASRNAIVKSLPAVETLGSASVICTDKTGTLTKNEMTVREVSTPSGDVSLTGVGYHAEGVALDGGEPLQPSPLLDEVRLVVGGGSLANTAELARGDADVRGDPTELALLVAAEKLGISDVVAGRFDRAGDIPFTAERKLMSSVAIDHDQHDQPIIITKGAPDVLIDRCTHERVAGSVVALSDRRRSAILQRVDELADQALRTLAVAYRPLPPERPPTTIDEDLEHDLVYLGVVGIIDPPRPEAAEAVAEAKRAGVAVVMITGDHPATARRIAEALGVAGESDRVLTGRELDRMSPGRLRDEAREATVFARVAPEHKLQIVNALRADDQIVAMTGDGVNDAPALKAADIGIAMGQTGTEVAKEAADMILADDDFATIVLATRQGRAIFANIRKFLRYLLSSNAGEVLTVFLGVVLAGFLGLEGLETSAIAVPLLATQILWINLLTDTGPALALGVDPPVDDLMAQPPRTLSDRVIDRNMLLSVCLTGIVMAVATLTALDAALPGGLIDGSSSLDRARTIAFTTLVLAQLFNTFNARSDRTTAFAHLGTNRLLWGAIALSLGLQALVVYVPLLNQAFSTAPLSAGDWFLATSLASSVLWVEELRKLLVRHRTRID